MAQDEPMLGDSGDDAELAAALNEYSWSVIDSLVEEAAIDWRSDVVTSSKFQYLYDQLSGREDQELERLASALMRHRNSGALPDRHESRRFDLFLSHSSLQRDIAGNLSKKLGEFEVDAFVAHDSIDFDQEWQAVIEDRLNSCEALLAVVSPEFAASLWCDQEVGWAKGRGIPVMSINAGRAPYGFFGVRQALPYKGDNAELAQAVVSRLLTIDATAQRMTDALVSALECAGNYDRAALITAQLNGATYWNPTLIRRAERALAFNGQVRDSNWGRTRARLTSILRRAHQASG